MITKLTMYLPSYTLPPSFLQLKYYLGAIRFFITRDVKNVGHHYRNEDDIYVTTAGIKAA